MAVVVTHGTADLHRLAGRAFEAADAAKSPALDNRTAIGRSITAILSSAHDALREAKELAAAEEHPKESAPSSSGAGEHTADADFEPDACSEQVCIVLIKNICNQARCYSEHSSLFLRLIISISRERSQKVVLEID